MILLFPTLAPRLPACAPEPIWLDQAYIGKLDQLARRSNVDRITLLTDLIDEELSIVRDAYEAFGSSRAAA